MKPILRKPDVLNLQSLLEKLEKENVYTFKSEKRKGVIYAYKDKELAMITASSGLLRMKVSDIESIGKELTTIGRDLKTLYKDIDARKRG